MKQRDKKLIKSWVENISIGGIQLRPLSAGHVVILTALENACMVADKEVDSSSMIEVVMLLTLDKEEICTYIDLPAETRSKNIAKFAATNIDEIDDVLEAVAEAISRIGVAMMEAEAVGKDIRHAS